MEKVGSFHRLESPPSSHEWLFRSQPYSPLFYLSSRPYSYDLVFKSLFRLKVALALTVLQKQLPQGLSYQRVFVCHLFQQAVMHFKRHFIDGPLQLRLSNPPGGFRVGYIGLRGGSVFDY